MLLSVMLHGTNTANKSELTGFDHDEYGLWYTG